MPETVQPSPEGISRTPTGEIAATPTEPTPTTTEEPKSDDQGERTLLNQGEKTTEQKSSAPDKYEPFKAPDGWTDKGWELDPAILEKADPLFRKLGLNQDQAQELVTFYAEQSQRDHEASIRNMTEKREEWVKEIKADRDLGHKLDTVVKPTVGKALDMLGPKLASEFREAMDYTGVGDNPAFIRAFYKFATMLTEGGFVKAGDPSKASQQRPGTRSDAAHSLYPHLP